LEKKIYLGRSVSGVYTVIVDVSVGGKINSEITAWTNSIRWTFYCKYFNKAI